jgi:hypothetical protein
MGRTGDTDEAEKYQQANSTYQPPIQILKVFSDIHGNTPFLNSDSLERAENCFVSTIYIEPEKTFKDLKVFRIHMFGKKISPDSSYACS